jgi:putative ABC transport system permease protein
MLDSSRSTAFAAPQSRSAWRDRAAILGRWVAVNPFASMKVLLAIRNLRRSGGKLWVSLFGIAFATLLMCAQGSLLYSFTQAASRVVDAVDADLWLVGKGTPTFEYVSPIPERYAVLGLGVEGVRDAGRGIAGWAPIERPNGDRGVVMLTGVESGYRGGLPAVADLAAAQGLSDPALVIDATDARQLGFDGTVRTAQIAAHRSHLLTTTRGFASFLGAPLVFTDYVSAHRFLRMERTQTSFIVLHVAPGYDLTAVRDALRLRLPDIDVWKAAEFSWRSRLFWLAGTGAGGALMLAAVLGFGIGLAIIAQTIYSITAENIEEFATMKAMGATDRDVRSVVLVQSLICGTIGGLAGLLLVEPFAASLRPLVPWMTVPFWMYFIVIAALIVLCILAARIAARPAVVVDPGRVFRA